MIVAIAGMLLASAVCVFGLLVARKAQLGLQQSRYQSLLSYGKETQAAHDKSELHRFGLPQLLRRTGGGMSAAGMSLNAMGLAGAAAILFGPALAAGGPTVISVGLPIIALLSLCVSASIAQLASSVPTAGGVYHAAYQLGGRRWGIRAGWLQVAGYATRLALLIGGFAYMADSLLASRLGYESTALTFGAIAIIGALSQAAICHLGSGFAHQIQAGGVWLQLFVVCAMLAGLVWLFWPGDYSPIVMYQWLDSGLEQPVQPLPFVLGALLLAGLFTGMDGAAHGAEEIVEPRVRVPWAIYLSTAYTYVGLFVLFFFMSIVLLPSGGLKLPSSILFGSEQIGTYMQYAYAALGGSYLLPVVVVLALWHNGQQTMAACSRAVFSLARDEALPFHRRLSSISFRRKLPLSAIWSTAAAALLLLAGAGYLLEDGVFLPLISAAIVNLHLASAIPIALSWMAERNERRTYKKGRRVPSYTGEAWPPWHVGAWSYPIRSVATVWLVLSAILTIGIVNPFGGVTAAAVLLGVTATAGLGLRGRTPKQRKALPKHEQKERGTSHDSKVQER